MTSIYYDLLMRLAPEKHVILVAKSRDIEMKRGELNIGPERAGRMGDCTVRDQLYLQSERETHVINIV
jgi:hypothetical protein